MATEHPLIRAATVSALRCPHCRGLVFLAATADVPLMTDTVPRVDTAGFQLAASTDPAAPRREAPDG